MNFEKKCNYYGSNDEHTDAQMSLSTAIATPNDKVHTHFNTTWTEDLNQKNYVNIIIYKHLI